MPTQENPTNADRLYNSQQAHIADLQKEVERLQNLVQILSDDKFFKPLLIPKKDEDVASSSPYKLSDYAMSTSTEDAGPAQSDEDYDIAGAFASLTEEYATLKDQK